MKRMAFVGSFFALGAVVSCGDSDSGGETATGAGAAGSGGAPTSGTGGMPTTGSGGGGTGAAGGAGGTGSFPPNDGFPAHWNDGTNCASEPPIQAWAFAEDTYILRQSLCTNFEGPFLYLFLGTTHALLQDTGTGDADVAGAVADIVAGWVASRGLPGVELLVTHSHSHGDHVGGDNQFNGQGTVVGTSTNAVISFFGFTDWPNDAVTLDLGGRTLDVLGIPGHHAAHVAVYDRRHGLMLTGDTLYPGRLYIDDFTAYKASAARIVQFVETGGGTGQAWPVQHVLGTHIEMTSTPMEDFAFGADEHPNEHGLPLGFEHVVELEQAVAAMGNTPVLQAHDDFIVYPL